MGIHQDQLADAPDVEAVQAGRLVSAELGGAANPNVYVVDTGRAGGRTRRGPSRPSQGRPTSSRRAVGQRGHLAGTTDPAAFRAGGRGRPGGRPAGTR